MALTLGAALLWYLQFFNAFNVPYYDFFSYQENALRYLQLQPPESFKRLPLFPGLIGLLSLVMPGPHPILQAAELLNLLLAPLCLWLIARITRQFLGARASLVVVALCAVNPVMAFSVVQPLSEMTILTCVLLVVDLSLRGSRWAYVAAFFASLTRYEAVLLIPALVLQDRLGATGNRKARSLAWGALASIGIVMW